MEINRNIDRSFKDRLGVLALLEKLHKENITYAEMDEIGRQLKKAGRSAVQPLLRRLWHEKNGILFSKYTYLLEFLDEHYWFDQIIQIALKRQDLEPEGRSAIMATLESCGVDLSLPPFARLFSGKPVPVADQLAAICANGEEGMLVFLEDMACLPSEDIQPFLDELAALPDQRVLEPLRLLLWDDDPDVVRATIKALGRARFSETAVLLKAFLADADEALQPLVEQSLRRLSFLGVDCSKPAEPVQRKPFYAAFAGPVDGNGYRHIWLTRWRTDDRLDSIDLQVHDRYGVKSVWGETAESVASYEDRAAARVAEELIESVAPEYAHALICDALYRSREANNPLPPEFTLRRDMFTPVELQPREYLPPSLHWEVKATPALLTKSVQLFEDEFFAGWSIETCRVYDLAEEWQRLESKARPAEVTQAVERLIETICREELQPRLADISRRLLVNADFLARTGVDGELVRAAVAAAGSIKDFALPCHLHPFLRRFAMESMVVAREALEEGYDLRDYPDEDEL